MDLHQLSLFLAVAETGSLSAAARIKNISQPVISIHVRNLEDHFGIALLDRYGRGVKLTEAGELLVQKIRLVLYSVRELNEALEELKGLERGHLRLGASTTPGVYVLPRLLGQFKKQYPGIEMDLQISNTAQVERWVSENILTLGVIGKKPESHFLEATPFLRDELVLITSPKHVLSKRRSVQMKELANYPFIVREQGSNTRQTYEEALNRQKTKLDVVLELGSTEAIKQAVAADLGISIVSPLSIQWEARQKMIHAVRVAGGELVRQFHIISLRDKHLSPATKRFLEKLERFQAAGSWK